MLKKNIIKLSIIYALFVAYSNVYSMSMHEELQRSKMNIQDQLASQQFMHEEALREGTQADAARWAEEIESSLALLKIINDDMAQLERQRGSGISAVVLPSVEPKQKLVKVKDSQGLVQYKLNNITFELKKGDILKQDTDSIVNAANKACLGGGGIDGYISKIGGAALLKLRKDIPVDKTHNVRCPETQARITRSGGIIKQNPKINFVIHAVGPVCSASGMTKSDKDKLANTYINTLKRVNAFNKDPKDKNYVEFAKVNTKDLSSRKIKSIAFPTISTGIFKATVKDSAPSIVQSVLDYVKSNPGQELTRIVFVFYNPKSPGSADTDFNDYKAQFNKYL